MSMKKTMAAILLAATFTLSTFADGGSSTAGACKPGSLVSDRTCRTSNEGLYSGGETTAASNETSETVGRFSGDVENGIFSNIVEYLGGFFR